MRLCVHENGLYMEITADTERPVMLCTFSTAPDHTPIPEALLSRRHLVEVQVTGKNQQDHHGCKHTGTNPGYCLRYVSHKDQRTPLGRKLEITQVADDLYVTSHLQFYDDIAVVRSWTVLENKSDQPIPLETVSSFVYTGLPGGPPQGDRHRLHLPHNTWYGEAQWKWYTPNALGYDVVGDFSVKRLSATSTGTWSCSEYLPMGAYESLDRGETFLWQIETSGAWHWEISDKPKQMYLFLSGPTFQENGFFKKLQPGMVFETVPCAVTVVPGGFQQGIQEMTKYRRVLRRNNDDNANPMAIFNDYMNCLWGDPTTEKLLPLIDAAAAAGCKYFCIDCGWYADGFWWDAVGEWLPSQKRFPRGIAEPLSYIRDKGMIPGLWLELEVVGIHAPMVKHTPTDWFFQRNGVPIIDEGRYQLDFRHPEVIAHANQVIQRLVETYGVGYIKMDYNINAGVGTDWQADSAGDGMLQHKNAYLAWLDHIFETYPNLVIENCGSGGMRMDYSLLSRHSIQSVTDQTDYLKMSAIAANCATAVTPEQAAIWSYPLREGDAEEVIFNMVNALLFRVHQSGHLAELTAERFAYIQEGIQYHHHICNHIKNGLPFWPMGLASFEAPYRCVGIDCGTHMYIALWRVTGGSDVIFVPLPQLQGKTTTLTQSYPKQPCVPFAWDEQQGGFTVTMAEKTARIFEISLL